MHEFMCVSTSLNTADFVNRVDQAHRLHTVELRDRVDHGDRVGQAT